MKRCIIQGPHARNALVRCEGMPGSNARNRASPLLLPGGALNADAIRMEPKAQEFARKMNQAQKPMAVICHAPWLLASAGLARGRKLTSYHTIQDDMRNAGADWVDREVVVDGNLVTSRKPDDIPAFIREFIRLLEAGAPVAAR